jgi:hypothetical protein
MKSTRKPTTRVTVIVGLKESMSKIDCSAAPPMLAVKIER